MSWLCVIWTHTNPCHPFFFALFPKPHKHTCLHLHNTMLLKYSITPKRWISHLATCIVLVNLVSYHKIAIDSQVPSMVVRIVYGIKTWAIYCMTYNKFWVTGPSSRLRFFYPTLSLESQPYIICTGSCIQKTRWRRNFTPHARTHTWDSTLRCFHSPRFFFFLVCVC